MIFKDYKTFKKTYNELFKKYHPDNLETGDSEKFIKIKQEYDSAKIIKNQCVNIKITIDQAFFGTIIETEHFKLKVPKYYYKTKPYIMVKGKDNNEYKVIIDIKPQNDEIITFDKDKNLLLTKVIKITFMDALLGCTKEVKAFDEKLQIKIEPQSIKQEYVIQHKGYMKKNLSERNHLTIKIEYDKLNLSDEDKQKLEEMRKKYE